MSHRYDDAFFNHVDAGARASAKVIVPILAQLTSPSSVLDIGCGRGFWLEQWMKLGVRDVVGVDGNYVIPTEAVSGQFVAADLAQPVDLGRCFDLVTCLEVAEHLPHNAAETLLDSLSRHSDAVLFSAAQPGQGGLNHVNEQPLPYWIRLFCNRGFEVFDVLRPRLINLSNVEPWYRHNSLLFIRAGALERLPPAERAKRVIPGDPLDCYEGWISRFRRALLRQVPRQAVNRIARWKHRMVAWYL